MSRYNWHPVRSLPVMERKGLINYWLWNPQGPVTPFRAGYTAFACMDFPAHRKRSAGKSIFCKFCLYFPSRMRGTCVFVVNVIRGMRATPGDGPWKLRIRYGQHTCTARYGRVNSVVNARELRARCDGTWTYDMNVFSEYQETIYQYWEIKMISRYCKTLMDLLI